MKLAQQIENKLQHNKNKSQHNKISTIQQNLSYALCCGNFVMLYTWGVQAPTCLNTPSWKCLVRIVRPWLAGSGVFN